MKFKDLPQNAKEKILTYNIDINEIVNPTDEEVRDLYARVNKYTVQLNKQELRRADFTGDFINLAEQLSDLEFFNDSKLFSTFQKRRMLDIEFVEELLCMQLEGEQDKKESIDDFCEKYEIFAQSKETVETDFLAIIQDIRIIFNEDLDISKTRFKQKADFYSLFGVIVQAKKANLTLKETKILDLQKRLVFLDKNIQPHSDDENMRTYAIHCTSDANSINSRIWRRDFLLDYIMPAYIEDEDECI